MGLIRFLLALAVVAFHSHPILGLRLMSGNDAVEIFFVISGFYMSLILRGKYARHENATRLFYENRFLRLYPTFLLCTLLTWGVFFGQYLLMHHLPNNGWMASYQTMTWAEKLPFIFANWSMVGLDIPYSMHYRAGQGFFWLARPITETLPDGSPSCGAFVTIRQAWSVGLEIWFYLLAPFLLRRSWWVLAGVLTVSLACKGWAEHLWHYPTYFLFPAQCCFFVIGASMHRAYEYFHVAGWSKAWGRTALPIVLVGICTYGYFPAQAVKYVFYPTFWLALPVIFGYSRKSVADRHLGNFSYPIYMVHLLMQNVLQTAFKLTSGNALALATVAAAAGIYVCLEIPIDGFRQRLVRRAAPAPEPVSA